MRKKLLLANINGTAYTYAGAHRFEAFNRDTFNPLTVYTCLDLGNIHGKTYAEKKADARQKAVDFSLFDCSGLSWGEFAEIGAYFENLAHRFGLVREFKENGVI